MLLHVENNGHLNKQLPGYNLYTICNKMSNDISTDVQYNYTIGGKNVNKQLPGYNLYTICNKMSNDMSSGLQ